MSAAANVASNVVPVAIKGISVNSGILTAIAVGIFSIIGIIIRQIVPFKEKGDKRRKDDMDGLRADIIAIKADAKEARDEAKRVSEIAQRLENIVACMRPAISILSAEVKRLDPNNPNNPALMQVADLMAMAAAGDMGIGKALAGLSQVKGVGE